MSDVFVSYKRSRRDIVERIVAALRAHGWSVWFDANIPGGERFRKEIETELAQSRCALVLWCDQSIESDFVLDEAGWARAQDALVQARWMEVSPPLGFGQQQQIDIIGWQQGVPALFPLIDAIERLIGPPGEPKRPAMGIPPGRPQRTQSSKQRSASEPQRAIAPVTSPVFVANPSSHLQVTLRTATTEHERFGLGVIDPQVRAAVEEARVSELEAIAAQHKALRASELAETAARGAYRGDQGHTTLDVEWSAGECAGYYATQVNEKGRNGYGIFRTTKGILKGENYAGQFKNGLQCGVGTTDYAYREHGRARYEGEFSSDRPNGHGVILWRDGRRFVGTVRDGKATGPGVFRSKTGDRYEGTFSSDTFDGYGVLWSASGRIKAQGVWTHGALTARLGNDHLGKVLDYMNQLVRRIA